MSTHTQGPWTIGEHQSVISKGWSIRSSDTSAIAYVLGDRNPELRANVCLIAAAPDLFEALTECLRYGAFLPPPIANVARSALDKATKVK